MLSVFIKYMQVEQTNKFKSAIFINYNNEIQK